jgi:hypothetical protein
MIPTLVVPGTKHLGGEPKAELLTFNSVTVPGNGGRLCFPADKGFIMLQVKPAAGQPARAPA